MEGAGLVAASDKCIHVLAIGDGVIDGRLASPEIVGGSEVVRGCRRIEVRGGVVVAAGVPLAAQSYGPARAFAEISVQLSVHGAVARAVAARHHAQTV